MQAVLERLEKLETENRGLKRVGALGLAALGVLALAGIGIRGLNLESVALLSLAVLILGLATARAKSRSRLIEASEFLLRDSKGRVRARLGFKENFEDHPFLEFYDAQGAQRTGIAEGALGLGDPSGNTANLGADGEWSWLVLGSEGNHRQATLSVLPLSAGLSLKNEQGNLNGTAHLTSTLAGSELSLDFTYQESELHAKATLGADIGASRLVLGEPESEAEASLEVGIGGSGRVALKLCDGSGSGAVLASRSSEVSGKIADAQTSPLPSFVMFGEEDKVIWRAP
jgi:hypothetical protein